MLGEPCMRRWISQGSNASASKAEYKRRDSRVEMDVCTLDSSFLSNISSTYLHHRIKMALRSIRASNQSEGIDACDLVLTEASDLRVLISR
jgi:hypothetical protein